MNVVQLRVVSDDRRERARDRRRRRFLDAASRIIDREGLGGLTMQGLADELDCAVGTIYTSFPSKAALVASLQGEAVEILIASYQLGRARRAELIEQEGGLDDPLGVLVELEAFGGFLAAAAVVYAEEWELQRLLLGSRPVEGAVGEDEPDPLGSLLRLVEPGRALLAEATAGGVLEPADELDRTVRWVAALDGVLVLERVANLDRHLLRAQHHARALTAELLVGWGADRADVEVAASHLERLAAAVPLAPPVEPLGG